MNGVNVEVGIFRGRECVFFKKFTEMIGRDDLVVSGGGGR